MAKKPKNYAGKAKAVKKDKDGDITHILFKNRRRFTPLKQAINMTKQGLTNGLQVNKTEKGREYLQGIGDGLEKNNLDNLPKK